MEDDKRGLSSESWVVSAGRPSTPGASLNTPLVPASAFILGSEDAYSRDDGTPTWEALERVVGGLEGGEAVAFASGMAAVSAVFEGLDAGSHIVWPDDCYQGVSGVIEAGRQRGFWAAERLDPQDTEAWIEAGRSADLLWLESPSNPLLVVANLAAICAAERKPGSLLAIDNTLATPINQRPLYLGADLSVHSVTKHIGGHSDLLCGIVVARDPGRLEQLRAARELGGATPGALEAYLATRGVRTLALRLERAQANAGVLAERLAAHTAVERVRYPGLPSHPSHDLAREQLAGYCTLISFDLVGGAEAADRACGQVELIRHATSFGGVESTMERRAAVPGQEHLPPGLVRLSVGIEGVDELWADLDRALRQS
jgi:cystathionine gamma-synthase